MRDFATKLIKFQLTVTDADTQIETAAGNQRQGRCVFRQSHGISQWQQHQVGPQTHPLRACRNGRVDHQW